MKHILIITLIIFYSNKIIAQESGYNPTVVVIGNFQPTINDASKINFSPTIKDSIIIKPELSYMIIPKKIETSFQIEPIKPMKLVDEKLTKLYKFLLKGGIGTYKTPYAEFFYSNQRSKKWSNNIHLKHISSSGKIKNVGYSGWSDNIAEANTCHYFNNLSLSGGISFSRNVVHYYGFNPDSVLKYFEIQPTKKETKQRFFYTNTYVNLFNISIDSSKLDYKFKLNYNYVGDYYKRQEHNINFKGYIAQNLQLLPITKTQIIGIKAETDIVSQIFTNKSSHTNTLISLKPFLNTKFGFFDINLGGDATIIGDSTSYLHFYPKAEVHFRIIRNILDFYGGFTGNAERYDYIRLSKENAFISSSIPEVFTYNKAQIYGGINASIAKNLDFYAKLSNNKIDNMPFFVRENNLIDTTERWLNKFTLNYDDINLLKLSGEFAYQQRERIKITLGGSWNEYSLTLEKQPWYKPPYEFFLSAKYNIQNKIIANAEVFYFGPVYGLTTGTYANSPMITKKIKSYIDINLLLEYRYNKVLSGFLNLYNISGTRFEKWLDYPSRKFSLMAGITYAL